MDRITQEAYQRQRILKWAEKKSVTAAAIRYKVSRKTVYKWRKRYDGTLESLKERSRAPHHIARKQTEDERAQVMRYAKRYAGDLLLGYERARANGYSRSYGCFKRTASQLLRPGKKRRKRKNKPYQRAEYPGQKVQICLLYTSAGSARRSMAACTGRSADSENAGHICRYSSICGNVCGEERP